MPAGDGAHINSANASVFCSIDKFKAIVGDKGLSDSSRYLVFVSSPIGQLTTDNALYCKGLNVKGASFDSTNRFSHGPERDIPYLERYGDGTTLTFYNDYEYSEYRYFQDWMTYIGDNDKGGGTWFIRWYKDFIGDIFIMSFDEEFFPRLGVSLAEVWPKSISDITMAYDARGKEISTFTVNLAFHHYELQHWPAAEIVSSAGKSSQVVGDIANPNSSMMNVTADLNLRERFNIETGQWDKFVTRDNVKYRALTEEEMRNQKAAFYQQNGVNWFVGGLAESMLGKYSGFQNAVERFAAYNRDRKSKKK